MSDEKETSSTENTNEKSDYNNNNNNKSDVNNSHQKEIPFDFKKFLEQMNHKNAAKIARFVRNFELEFERYPRTVNDQIKIVREFLEYITGKMRECELWKNATEQEFENAKEGMEKLVMNRLYKLTFTPAIKGQSVTDDIECDNLLHQRIEIFRWIREEHLDIPITSFNDPFLNFAKNELLKINQYKAPRDKLICVLNCCKVIYGLIKRVDGEEGADKFLPILIFVILKANPEHLMSNVQYVYRFRSPEKLQSEAGYYLSSLMSAISFIESMNASLLTITKEEFDKNIEMTVKELSSERPELPENNREINYENAIHPSARQIHQNNRSTIINHIQAKMIFEKTIQKPLDFMGKILTDINQDIQEHVSSQFDFHNNNNNNNNMLPQKAEDSSKDASDNATNPNTNAPNAHNLSQQLTLSERLSYNISSLQDGGVGIGNHNEMMSMGGHRMERSLSLESTSSQNSRDYTHVQEEVEQVTDRDIQKSLESLKSMFPNTDPDLCEEVFYGKNCNMNEAIDKLLEMSDCFSITSSECGDRDAIDFIDLNKLSLDHESKGEDNNSNNNNDNHYNGNSNIESSGIQKEKERELKN